MELSSLPRVKWWGDDYAYQIGDFWFMPSFMPGMNRVLDHFNPLPTDIILASFPKAGSTWIKALVYAIVHRSSEHLAVENPHELAPFLEIQVFGTSSEPQITPGNGPRIFATHIPYQTLSKVLDASEARVIYLARNPKDTLISMWHFANKWAKAKEEPWQLDEAIDKFCLGHVPFGPYYDHVTEYRELSMKKPSNAYFVTYEDLSNDPEKHVKKLAEFLGCPFGEDEEEMVEEIVKSCSFEVLSNHTVNKSDEYRSSLKVSYSSYFRKGKIGDHEEHITAETIDRIDAITREKFHSSGFMYGI